MQCRNRLRLEVLESRAMLSATAFEHNGIGYLVDAGNRELDRYDIANQSWLPSTPLSGAAGAPTVAVADADGIYVAYGTAVYRYNLNGTSPVHLLNAANSVSALHTDGNVLFVNHSHSLYAKFVSINKTTNAIIANFENYVDAVGGSSIAPQANRIFGRSIGISPADITYVAYNDDGTFTSGGDSPYHGSYPYATYTWTFPDGGKVVDDSGTVYSTNSLTRLNSFGSHVDEIDFVGGVVPIVRNGTTLSAFNVGLLPTGSTNLSAAPREMFVNSQNVIAIHADGSAPTGYRIEVVALSSLNAPEPGEPIDPRGLSYTPDKLALANDGTVLIFSKAHQSVFRWNPKRQDYGTSISLIGAPDHMAYSAETNTLYLGYNTGLIRKIDLNAPTPVEVPFATLPSSPMGLATAGKYVFAVDPSGAWVSHYTFDVDGTQKSAVEWNYYSTEYIWNEAQQRMYFFRDDTSPNDLHAESIINGQIAGMFESPLHGGAFSHPIRVAPDGSVVVLGSGAIHDATSLALKTQSLSYAVSDIAWLGNRLYTVRNISGVVQVQEWLGSTFAPGPIKQFSDTAQSLTAVGANRLLLITMGSGGVPTYTLLDSALNVVSKTLPAADAGADARIPVGVEVQLDGRNSYDPDDSPSPLTYQWSLVSGPGVATFGNATGATTSFVGAAAGEYVVSLTVSDGANSAFDTMIVQVRNNAAPVANATLSATTSVASRIPAKLDGSRSADADNDSLQYQWTVESSPAGSTPTIANAQQQITSFSTSTPGVYTLKLTVSDGFLADEDLVVITVGVNAAPVANASLSTLTGVAGRTTPALNASNSTDPDGDQLTYQWQVVASPAGSTAAVNAPTAKNTTFTANMPGQYSVQLTVSDGLLTDTDVIVITMGENAAPIADASASMPSAVAGALLTLDGRRSSDPDGDSLAYSWTVVATSNGTYPGIYEYYSSLASLVTNTPGTYAVALTVSDGLKTDVDYFIVTVRGNQPPVADLSLTRSTGSAGVLLPLDGSRSSDPDGDPLTYAWQVLTSTSGVLPPVADPNAQRTSFLPTVEGAYLVQLTVNDGVAAATAFQLITITPAVAPAMPGDIDGDHIVDGTDFLLVQRRLGKPAISVAEGDVDDDHDVDGHDMAMVLAHFGTTAATVNPTIPGEASGDGVVDGADFLIWQRQLGSTSAAASRTDANNNGVVDGADLALWKSNFGQQAAGPQQAAQVAAAQSAAVDAIFAGGDFTNPFASPSESRRSFRPRRRAGA